MKTPSVAEARREVRAPRPSLVSPAMAGAAAAAVGLAAGELASGLVAGSPSLLLSVGDWVVRRAPPLLEDFAIATFGTNDKVVLVGTMAAVALAGGALVGRLAVHRLGAAAGVFAAGGAFGAWAAVTGSPARALGSLLAAIAAVAAGVVTLSLLLRPQPAPVAGGRRDTAGDAPDGDEGRRRALGAILVGVAGAAVVGAGAGRLVSRLLRHATLPSDVVLASPARPLPPPAAGTAFAGVPGLPPLFTPNRDYFRIDTALMVPRVDLDTWRLRLTGMVDRPFELSYEELAAMPQIESDITLACVSNEVGGRLVGNARWQGVPLRELLDRAGVRRGATQVVGRSVDGWTAGFPTAVAMDGRPALVALGMNGEPLPTVHGFPARLVVPGLYGYVSATKWLGEIDLTTLEAFDGYWVPRGWSKLGPVLLQSRIDVPRDGAPLPAGRQALAGVAWAPTRGIARVEVSIDDGEWREATLAGELSTQAWRQWKYEWDASPGRHRIAVRATSSDGEVQTSEQRRPRPAGASGHHTIQVQVR